MARRKCAEPPRGCGRNRDERFFTSERGTVCEFCQKDVRKRASRNSRLQKVYDITQDEYEVLLAAQDGKCAGCGGDRRYNLAVDHDHALEKEVGSRLSIRGLLCKRCNGILRDAWDMAQVLRNLADYLEDPPAQKILAALQQSGTSSSCASQSDAPSAIADGSSPPGSTTSSAPLRLSA